MGLNYWEKGVFSCRINHLSGYLTRVKSYFEPSLGVHCGLSCAKSPETGLSKAAKVAMIYGGDAGE